MHVQTCQQMSINSTSHNGAHYCFHIQLSNSTLKEGICFRRNIYSNVFSYAPVYDERKKSINNSTALSNCSM